LVVVVGAFGFVVVVGAFGLVVVVGAFGLVVVVVVVVPPRKLGGGAVVVADVPRPGGALDGVALPHAAKRSGIAPTRMATPTCRPYRRCGTG
jgi:hypothetical protein